MADKNSTIPKKASEAVLVECSPMPEGHPEVKGYAFDGDFDSEAFFRSFKTTGFQATNLGLAAETINKMIKWRPTQKTTETKENQKCTIFLGYTSNMISSGIRESLVYLVKHRKIDVIVTTGGGIEEDLIKCLAPHYIGDFNLDGKKLREKGHNRIGNLLVPNENYCKFEDWIVPIIHRMQDEQDQNGVVWTPSKVIDRLGKEIDDERSVCYWAFKNKIPIFSPALVDGSIGDMFYFQNYKRTGFILDTIGDIRKLNDIALHSEKTGMIILGGGLVKHQICNANLMRNGADFSVYVNTGIEYDGSDSGASPDEAISWGKIRGDSCKPVKVFGDATIIFPILVAMTFAKH